MKAPDISFFLPGVELYSPGTRTRNSPRVAALRSCGFLPAVHQLFEPSRGALFSEAVNSIFVFALIFHGLLVAKLSVCLFVQQTYGR